MDNDFTITRIVNVFDSDTTVWKRDFTAPRIYEAVVLFTAGEIEYTFPDCRVTARVGDILYLPGRIPYSGVKKTERTAFLVVDFECETPDEFERIAPSVCAAQDPQLLLTQFRNAVDAWRRQPIDVYCRVRALVYTLIAEHYAAEVKPDTPTQTILRYIAAHLGDASLSNKTLCERFFLSESQLRRNIAAATGLTPNRYVARLRINRAKTLLRSTDKTVAQIAAECGFASPYYFSRCFAEAEGTAPSAYRRRTERQNNKK